MEMLQFSVVSSSATHCAFMKKGSSSIIRSSPVFRWRWTDNGRAVRRSEERAADRTNASSLLCLSSLRQESGKFVCCCFIVRSSQVCTTGTFQDLFAGGRHPPQVPPDVTLQWSARSEGLADVETYKNPFSDLYFSSWTSVVPHGTLIYPKT